MKTVFTFWTILVIFLAVVFGISLVDRWMPKLHADCTGCSDGPPPGASPGTTFIVVPPSTCQEQFPALPALAARLNVKPGYSPQRSVVLGMCDGTVYDLFALVNAFLDKMEQTK